MPSDSEIVSVNDLRPGQDYYVVGSIWGKAPPADKTHEHDPSHADAHPSDDELRIGQSYYIVGTSWGKSQAPPTVAAAAAWQIEAPAPGREKWTIDRADGGYYIKNAEHGSYLGYHREEAGGAHDSGGAQDGSANLNGAHSIGLTGSKTPFAWTAEPHMRDDGSFRFTVPHTELHIDFASADDSAHEYGAEYGSGYGTERGSRYSADSSAGDWSAEHGSGHGAEGSSGYGSERGSEFRAERWTVRDAHDGERGSGDGGRGEQGAGYGTTRWTVRAEHDARHDAVERDDYHDAGEHGARHDGGAHGDYRSHGAHGDHPYTGGYGEHYHARHSGD